MECIRGLYVRLLLELYLGLIVLFFDFFIRSIRLGIQPVEIVASLCVLVIAVAGATAAAIVVVIVVVLVVVVVLQVVV